MKLSVYLLKQSPDSNFFQQIFGLWIYDHVTGYLPVCNSLKIKNLGFDIIHTDTNIFVLVHFSTDSNINRRLFYFILYTIKISLKQSLKRLSIKILTQIDDIKMHIGFAIINVHSMNFF